MSRTQTQTHTHGSTVDPNPKKNDVGTSCKAAGKCKKGGDEGSDPSLTNAEIKKYRSNLNDREICPTKFYHKESMERFRVDEGLTNLFERMDWTRFLNPSDRTFKEPTLEYLSTFVRDNITKILTFQLQRLHHRITYEELSQIMGTNYIHYYCSHTDTYLDFLCNPDACFWRPITGLDSFNPIRQRENILCILAGELHIKSSPLASLGYSSLVKLTILNYSSSTAFMSAGLLLSPCSFLINVTRSENEPHGRFT